MNKQEAIELLQIVEKRPFNEPVFWSSMISDEHFIREGIEAKKLIDAGVKK